MINSSLHNLCVCPVNTPFCFDQSKWGSQTHSAEGWREGWRRSTCPQSIHRKQSLCPLFASDWPSPQREREVVRGRVWWKNKGGVRECKNTDTLETAKKATTYKTETFEEQKRICSKAKSVRLHLHFTPRFSSSALPAAFWNDTNAWEMQDRTQNRNMKRWLVCLKDLLVYVCGSPLASAGCNQMESGRAGWHGDGCEVPPRSLDRR